MANEEQLSILKQGVEVWNKWRRKNYDAEIDFTGANLSGTDLSMVNLEEADLGEVDFRDANLTEANLEKADLALANLRGAILRKANFKYANLIFSNLSEVNLCEANLQETVLFHSNLKNSNLRSSSLVGANLYEADLSDTDLVQANLKVANLTRTNLHNAVLTDAVLTGASLVETKVDGAKVSRSQVYGINVWNLVGEFENQTDLVITPEEEPAITVDNIKIAQFIYLILNNHEIRDVINTLTSKSVLILGRFALEERKTILDALRNKLREYDLLPIVFDFDRPSDKDFTETIKTLAGLSYFVIADITNPKSSPLELQATVPDYQIPFVPIIQEGESPFAMMVDLHKKYNWVLEPRSYDSIETLMKALKPGIIDPAIKMHYELRLIKAKEQTIHPLRDFIDN